MKGDSGCQFLTDSSGAAKIDDKMQERGQGGKSTVIGANGSANDTECIVRELRIGTVPVTCERIEASRLSVRKASKKEVIRIIDNILIFYVNYVNYLVLYI